MTSNFLVEWSMYFDAEDTLDAARQAWAALDDATRYSAGASVLFVSNEDTGIRVRIDMEDESEEDTA